MPDEIHSEFHDEVMRRLEAAAARESRASVRALAAAERAVEEGRLNLAKVLRASAYAARRRALTIERQLLAGSPAVDAVLERAEEIDASIAELGADASRGGAAAGCVGDVLRSEREIVGKTVDALANERDVSEKIVAQFIWGCSECGYLTEGGRPEICAACGAFSAEFEMFAPFFSATTDHLLRRKPNDIRRMLEGDGARLRASLAVVDDGVLRRRAAEGDWCAAEIAGHMIDIADVTARRLRAVVEPGTPVEPDRHILPWKLLDGQAYDVMPASELCTRFEGQITAVLALMSRLDDAGWRKKTEWIAGRVSAVDIGSWLANHNLAHQRQIDAIIGQAT